MTVEERKKRDEVIVDMSERIKVLTEENDSSAAKLSKTSDQVAALREKNLTLSSANGKLEGDLKAREDEIVAQATESEAQLRMIEAQNREAESQQMKMDAQARYIEDLKLQLKTKEQFQREEYERVVASETATFSEKVVEMSGEISGHLTTIEALKQQLADKEKAKAPQSPAPSADDGKIKELVEANDALSAELSSANGRNAKLSEDLEEAASEIDELRAAQCDFDALKQQLADNEKVKAPQSPAPSADDGKIKELIEANDALGDELRSANGRNAKLSEDLEEAASEIDELRAAQCEFNETLAKANDEIESVSRCAPVSSLHLRESSLPSNISPFIFLQVKQRNEELQSKYDELQNDHHFNNDDDQLKQDYGDLLVRHTNLEASSSAEISSLNKSNAQLQRSFDELAVKHSSLTSKHSSLSSTTAAQITSLNSQLDEAKRQLSIAQKETITTINNSTRLSNSFLTNAPAHQQKRAHEEEVSKIKREHSHQVSKIEAAHSLQLQRVSEALQASNLQVSQLHTDLNSAEVEADGTNELIKSLQEQLNAQLSTNTRLTSKLHKVSTEAAAAASAAVVSKQNEVQELATTITSLTIQLESLKEQNANLSSIDRTASIEDVATPPQQKLLRRQKVELENEMRAMKAHYENELQLAKVSEQQMVPSPLSLFLPPPPPLLCAAGNNLFRSNVRLLTKYLHAFSLRPSPLRDSGGSPSCISTIYQQQDCHEFRV